MDALHTHNELGTCEVAQAPDQNLEQPTFCNSGLETLSLPPYHAWPTEGQTYRGICPVLFAFSGTEGLKASALSSSELHPLPPFYFLF